MVRAVTIDNNSLTIDDTQEEAESEEPESPHNTPEPVEAVEPPKRKPGRPAGSKSKIQGKPRAKRKVVQPEPESASSEEDVTVRAPQQRRIPTEAVDSNTAMMLALLRQQQSHRQNRKAELWRSWFK